jgi:2'-5' RNA ligase
MEQKMRCFIAIPLDDAVNDALETELRKMQNFDLRIVRRSNRHITIKFLGEINPEMTMELTKVLQNLAEKIRRGILPGMPQITLQGFGFFPNARKPRVFWLGVHDPQKWLKCIFAELEDALCDLGFSHEERPYFPHITLARPGAGCGGARGSMDAAVFARPHGDFTPNIDANEIIKKLDNVVIPTFVPQRIVLYSSLLGGREARYDELAGFPLAASTACLLP